MCKYGYTLSKELKIITKKWLERYFQPFLNTYLSCSISHSPYLISHPSKSLLIKKKKVLGKGRDIVRVIKKLLMSDYELTNKYLHLLYFK
jgi:hypothetical protein